MFSFSKMKYVFPYLLLSFFALVVMPAQSLACECRERRGVREEFAASEHVVLLILDSIENDKVKLSVALNYKGALKADEQVVFKQGAGKDCKWKFDEQDLHKLFLFYLEERPKDGVWQASTCSRSAGRRMRPRM
jgi:hypothetical protein